LPTPTTANPSLPALFVEIPVVSSDSRGEFVISNLEPGSYRMSISCNGYVRQEYGQIAFLGLGAVLTLSADSMSKSVPIFLTPTGNVGGTLRDTSGAPIVGVPVQLMRRSYNERGQRFFQSVGTTRTNDRGEYRLYWATPGRYYLTAGNPLVGQVGNSLVGPTVSANDPRDTFVFAFYPGVAEPAAAVPIEIGPGDEIRLDFAVPRQESFRIRGRVVDGLTNRPPNSIGATLTYPAISGAGAVITLSVPYDPITGTFEIRNIPAGSFWMTVSSVDRYASTQVNVTNHIEALNIVLGGQISLAGKVSFDGRTDSTLPERVRVQVRNTVTGAPYSEVVNADGTFRFESLVAAEYRVTISSDGTASYFIKSARFGRDDVLSRPLVLSDSFRAGSPLDIVVSPNVAQVEGVVMDAQVRPAAGVQAVLVPENDRDRTELFRAVITDPTGRFILRNVVPGDYKMFAWDVLEPNGYFDPDFIRKYEPQGKLLHVAESSASHVDLKLISVER
jgi:hypothetical protein